MNNISAPPGRSYASALTGNTNPTVTERIIEVLVPKATRNEIQANATIASLQAEVKSLRSLLLGATTPSTVTETSAPDPHTHDDRMATIETNMENMTKQFTTWMTDLRNDFGHGSQHPLERLQIQQPPHDNDITMHDKDEIPVVSHRSKRTDTRGTPERTAHMEGVELFGENGPSPHPSLDPLSTQPTPMDTPPRDNDGKRNLSPSSEQSTTSMQTMLAALAQASPTYPNGYDTDSPMYTYTANDDGTLLCVGLAQPSDFHPDGTIRGPQPTEDQSERLRQLLSPPSPHDPSNAPSPRSLSPDHTQVTQDETVASSIASPQGSPPPDLKQPTEMGSLLSLPAEEAKTGNE
jgi:hypothetical protein